MYLSFGSWYMPAKLGRDANMDRLCNIHSSLKSKNKKCKVKRKYDQDYIKYAFTCIKNNQVCANRIVFCGKWLAARSMKKSIKWTAIFFV